MEWLYTHVENLGMAVGKTATKKLLQMQEL